MRAREAVKRMADGPWEDPFKSDPSCGWQLECPGPLKSRLQAGHFLRFSPFRFSHLVRPTSSLTPVSSVKSPHWHFHPEGTRPAVKLGSSSLSDNRGRREAEEFTWPVLVTDPGRVHDQFWTCQSRVQAHQSASRWCEAGRRGRCLCGPVGIVKNTRRLFPY